MQLIDSQKKRRAEKFVKHQDNPTLTTLESILELEEEMEEKHKEMMDCMAEMMNKEREDEIEVTLNII